MIGAYLIDKVHFIHDEHDAWGNKIPASHLDIVVRGRIVYKARRIPDFKGEEVISTFSLLVRDSLIGSGAGNVIDFSWFVVVNNYEWPIKMISKPRDFRTSHIEVFL
jgi:hypothetical protein